MAEHQATPGIKDKKDFDDDVKRDSRSKGEIDRRHQRDSDPGAPEIKGEGGARGKSGGSSQDGNQENTRRGNGGGDND